MLHAAVQLCATRYKVRAGEVVVSPSCDMCFIQNKSMILVRLLIEGDCNSLKS